MKEILELTVSQTLNALKKKTFSATELTKAYLEAINDIKELNNYIFLSEEKSLSMAKASDEKYMKGEQRNLEGIPIGVKDLFCTDGIETTACSNILKGFSPTYESTVTQNLWNEGAVLLGKLNCDEFAMGSSNDTSYFGSAINPWSKKETLDLSPGGSSGGSASAVASRSTLLTIGTDTGGSIRQPAALCGIVGVKPSYGRCSRWGIVAFASSLDQAGPFARNVEDAALLLEYMASYDPKDSTSSPRASDNFSYNINDSIKGLKIGIPKEYIVDGMDNEIGNLWLKGQEWLKSEGAEIIDISLPHTHYALPAYYIIAPAEASSNLARYDGVKYGKRSENLDSLDEMYAYTRGEGFGNEVKRRIFIGTYALSSGYYDAYYLKAQKVRRLILNDFEDAFKKVDAILTPTTPNPAFSLKDKKEDPIKMYLNDIFTVPLNLAGLPGISVPAGLSENKLPLGLQVISGAFEENKMFRVARTIERCAEFKNLPNILPRGF